MSNTAVEQNDDFDDDGFSVEPPNLEADREHPLYAKVAAALQEVYDPEIPVDIFKLGLIYRIAFEDGPDGVIADVKMTLTSPGCPVAGEMPGMVENAIATVSEIHETRVELIWDPPWNLGMMSDIAKIELNMI